MSLQGYSIPASLHNEIDELEVLIKNYHAGSVLPTELKAHRVPFGVYEQRKKDTYMVRVRCTAGIITPFQLKTIAQLSKRFGSGSLHVTTRQEIQIHDVGIDDLVPIIRGLADVGLSTRGGGGNTVRNITAPWDSGITQDELFDVTPYAAALTTSLIARSDSWLLPRKYKIAFSNSEKDTAFATVNDLGLIASIKDNKPGFKVLVAGGMGRLSQAGHLLHEFVPASEILVIAEAIKRVFSKYGNRKNKHAARLRFLWNSLGRDKFVSLYNEEKAGLLKEGLQVLTITEYKNEKALPKEIAPDTATSLDFETWKQRYTGIQKQCESGFVKIPLLFGIIDAQKALALAEFLIPFGENTIRFTHNQNIALRNIPLPFLPNVYRLVKKVSYLSAYAPLFGNAVACAGASTCQLGICRSRGALQGIVDQLKFADVNLDDFNDLHIHVSGCSNTCGQHSVADLGFFGKVGRKNQHSFPSYFVVAGARIDAEGAFQLAEKIDEINAKDLPFFVEELLAHYGKRKSVYSRFSEYINAEGKEIIRKLCDKFRNIPEFEIDKSYYRDWGDSEIFSLAGKGTGECSAGLFDLIEIDLAKLRELRSFINENYNSASIQSELYDLVLVSSRMLLITRGVEAATDADVLRSFKTLFINENLIDARFADLIERAIAGKDTVLSSLQEQVLELSTAVEKLYEGMDNSLQFKVQGQVNVTVAAETSEEKINIDYVKDLRGVACPMNFVKTKMELAKMSLGQILEITLDDGAPIDNVPRSITEEGHLVLEQVKIDDYWIVRIRKGN